VSAAFAAKAWTASTEVPWPYGSFRRREHQLRRPAPREWDRGLDEASLKLILTQPKNALVKQYQRLFEMEGVDLTVAEEALGAIAKRAIDRKTGARGLRSIMEAILLDTMFELPSLDGVDKVLISQQVVEGSAGPLYMYAARNAGPRAS
jgi:ATP-dependent protease Clp ATPase subunit